MVRVLKSIHYFRQNQPLSTLSVISRASACRVVLLACFVIRLDSFGLATVVFDFINGLFTSQRWCEKLLDPEKKETLNRAKGIDTSAVPKENHNPTLADMGKVLVWKPLPLW